MPEFRKITFKERRNSRASLIDSPLNGVGSFTRRPRPRSVTATILAVLPKYTLDITSSSSSKRPAIFNLSSGITFGAVASRLRFSSFTLARSFSISYSLRSAYFSPASYFFAYTTVSLNSIISLTSSSSSTGSRVTRADYVSLPPSSLGSLPVFLSPNYLGPSNGGVS